MGKYLNESAIIKDSGLRSRRMLSFKPINSKEDFLEEFGVTITKQDFKNIVLTDETKNIPVVLIDNGHFTAALVADRQSEIDYVGSYDDVRPKKYYLVAKSHLKEELVH